ncbi:hypothetical protein F5H01DRAFT_323062 [Linnemannia elongata]|nr:hypothetical protein F5H01DRAFT_323062 [Linnemannia elongata]
MNMNELLFGVVTQSGGRKTDTLVLAKEVSGGEVHYIECSVNEHKPLHVGQATLKEQSRKVVRINRSILSCTGSQKTALFIDARGFRGKIYGMRVIEDVYGVSAALGQVCLQSNKFEMTEFLSGPSLLTLFRYKSFFLITPFDSKLGMITLIDSVSAGDKDFSISLLLDISITNEHAVEGGMSARRKGVDPNTKIGGIRQVCSYLGSE